VTPPNGLQATGTTRDPEHSQEIADAAADDFLSRYPAGGGAPIVVVIPALNEVESVADVIHTVPDTICGLAVETLLVDDGSRDGTSHAAAAAGALVCTVPINIGQGAAFRLGYRLARARGASYIATADADGQFDPRELPALIGPLVADEADFVNGSRRLGHTYTTDPVRMLGVFVFGTLISALTGTKITDPANGLRAFKAEVTERVQLRQTQYQTSEMLICTLANGFRVKEVPATMYKRAAGESKKGGNWIYGLRFARVIVTTWWAMRPTARLRSPGGRGLLW
jgi:glycosyltransferase involved in cell wall biosynthesis